MKRIASTLVLTLLPAIGAAAPLGDFSEFYVFGDSLSDPGNLIADNFGGTSPIPGLFPNNQITDGDTWASQLGADFGSGNNFAYAAARAVTSGGFDIPTLLGPVFVDPADLPEQVSDASAALLGGLIDPGPNPLAAIWIGGNDVRASFSSLTPVQDLTLAINSIVTQTGNLLAQGIPNIVVMGVPDIGLIPEVLTLGPIASGAATAASELFNTNLQTALAAAFGGVVDYFDTFSIFQDVATNAAALGLTNITDPCTDNFILGVPLDCTGYFFYDDIHPTEAVHALIAAEFAATALIPLPAGGLLLISGLGGFILMRRRKA